MSSFPTVKLFKDGEFREDFDGDRTVDGFKSYYNTAKNMGDKAPSDVVELTAKALLLCVPRSLSGCMRDTGLRHQDCRAAGRDCQILCALVRPLQGTAYIREK